MAKASFVLKRKLKSGEYGIYIRILHMNLQAMYLSIPFAAFSDQWNKDEQRFNKNKADYKKLNKSLGELEELIEEILSSLIQKNAFTFDSFKVMFQKKDGKTKYTVDMAFCDKLDRLKQANRLGTHRAYNNCYSSLKKYSSLDIPFSAVDFEFLSGFEQYHAQLDNKANTIGAYFRAFRSIHYEYCKFNGISEPNIYKRFNVSRLKNEVRKKSLNKDQLKKLIDYDPPSEAQLTTKHIFLFSFYARGINLMDMLQLTDKNLEGDVLVYRRQKTGKQMKIKLVGQALDILRYFQNDSPYLFPYMREGDIAKYRISDVNRNINRRLKLIGDEIGIKQITMYSARHTFAELQYKSGVRIEIFSQMLGHSDLKTTQTYLRSFTDDEVDNAASKVFDSLL